MTASSAPSSADSNSTASATTSKPGTSRAPIAAKPPGETTRRAATFERRHVDARARRELLGEQREPARQQRYLRRGRALLRPEDACRVGELGRDVARDRHVDSLQAPSERVDGAEAAVGRRAPADRDDDPRESLASRDRDELTRAARRGAQRIVLGADEREPARARHLDHGDAARKHTPLGIDRIAERSRHPRRATGPTPRGEQRVERAFATVGERQFDDVVEARATEPRAIAAAASRGRQGAAELVRTRNGADHVQ